MVFNVKFLTDAVASLGRSWSDTAAPWQWTESKLIIRSPAGEFPITIDHFDAENDQLIIVGRMGVWDTRTHIDAGEFLRLLGKLLLSPTVLLYAAKAPFLALRGSPKHRD
jgi:hypothetical protein